MHWFITTFQAVQLVWKLEHGYSFVTVELIYFSTILQTLTDLRIADSCSYISKLINTLTSTSDCSHFFDQRPQNKEWIWYEHPIYLQTSFATIAGLVVQCMRFWLHKLWLLDANKSMSTVSPIPSRKTYLK